MGNISLIQRHLLDAIDDYPKAGLSSSKDLLAELHKKIDSPITFESLKNYSVTIDLSKNAWEAESISSLLLAFKGNETKSLEEIIALSGIQ
jgi:hypothetical protein